MELIKFSIILALVLCQTWGQSTQNGRQNGRRNSAGDVNERRGGGGSHNQCARTYSVDHLVLALQWPTSFCWTQQRCGRQVDHNRWQIHGLWPSKRTYGQSPEFCCLSTRFDSRLMDSIRDQLLLKWKSAREDARHDSFWRHEYNKHGSCALRLSEKLSNQFNYFNTTLGLYDSIPLNDWFRNSSITPNNDKLYSVDQIHGSIERRLNSIVRLECSPNPEDNPEAPPILSEIHVCLDKNNLRPIDCPNRDDRQCFNRSNRSNRLLFPKHS